MLDLVKTSTPNIYQYNGGSISSKPVEDSGESKMAQSITEIPTDNGKSDGNIDSKKIVDDLNQISDSLNVDIKFAYNDKIDEVYINITDKNTGKVIRKLPSEEAMKIKETMKELVGSLFDIKG